MFNEGWQTAFPSAGTILCSHQQEGELRSPHSLASGGAVTGLDADSVQRAVRFDSFLMDRQVAKERSEDQRFCFYVEVIRKCVEITNRLHATYKLFSSS